MNIGCSILSKFTAPVVYAIPPGDEIKRRFPAGVADGIAGREFEPIDHCRNVKRENRVVTFDLVKPSFFDSSDAMRAKMVFKGLRPALFEELLGFVAAFPEEAKDAHIVAIGSVLRLGTMKYVASAYGKKDLIGLHLFTYDCDWMDEKLLAVRE